MKYNVQIMASILRQVEVEAENLEEMKKKALEKFGLEYGEDYDTIEIDDFESVSI